MQPSTSARSGDDDASTARLCARSVATTCVDAFVEVGQLHPQVRPDEHVVPRYQTNGVPPGWNSVGG